jgi:hypothetical protein
MVYISLVTYVNIAHYQGGFKTSKMISTESETLNLILKSMYLDDLWEESPYLQEIMLFKRED